jgi:S1-C subfamily serine protease
VRAAAGRSALAALLALATLGGCGGSDDGRDSAAQAPRPPTPTPRVIVETAASGFNAARVYREAAPGVVTVRSIFDAGAGEGSGFVLDEAGRIVTNAHVVTDESSGEREPAKAVFVEFPDHNIVPAEIVGFDPFYDVGLLQVEPNGFDLHPLQLGDDRDLVVGQPVAAIGNPFGEQQSLSLGIVSAMDRSVRSLTQFMIEGAIQTDASINPGNSGGPLLDASARVIGINQQIETESGANDGVGFAVPVSAVRRSVEQLREDGEAEYAYIGVSSQPLYPQLADKLGIEADFGGLLSEIVAGGPADQAGLKGGNEELRFQAATYTTGGDVILAIDGRRLVTPDDLASYISSLQPGERVMLDVLRDGGEREQVEVTLGRRPEDVQSG